MLGGGVALDRKIDISNERKITQEEEALLLSMFVEEHPEQFREWIELEQRGGGLDAVWLTIMDFLKSKCTYRSRTDLTSTAVTMRGLVSEVGSRTGRSN